MAFLIGGQGSADFWRTMGARGGKMVWRQRRNGGSGVGLPGSYRRHGQKRAVRLPEEPRAAMLEGEAQAGGGALVCGCGVGHGRRARPRCGSGELGRAGHPWLNQKCTVRRQRNEEAEGRLHAEKSWQGAALAGVEAEVGGPRVVMPWPRGRDGCRGREVNGVWSSPSLF